MAIVKMTMRVPSRGAAVPKPISSRLFSKSPMEATIESIPAMLSSPIPPIHYH
ncbi:hypothetical protein CCACVL1_05635 [Corchorus capsularis]|uniref:Uncharacterized protein n=1 Tax=Corchorus capsularis TaxID=210143 RepID=A0A1R3JJJ2_COCAP|nr:hypothetical protein CCACVL1_05635 [Corchorus capsularis]